MIHLVKFQVPFFRTKSMVAAKVLLKFSARSCANYASLEMDHSWCIQYNQKRNW